MYNIDNYEPSIIAEKIKKECMRQNITAKTMLQELNINHAALTKMSHGGAPSYIAIARICDYLNISIDTLLDRPAASTPATPEPAPVDLDAAIELLAAAANLSADYIRGILHLPPTSSTDTNDI